MTGWKGDGSRELANDPLSGEFGWKGKYIVVPSSEKVRKEP